jgi:hypothetical protein
VCEDDFYWSGEVGCGAVVTLETGRDNWRGQSLQHTILFIPIQDSSYVAIICKFCIDACMTSIIIACMIIYNISSLSPAAGQFPGSYSIAAAMYAL